MTTATSPVTTDRPAYLNPELPTAERVADLVGRMTLEEKLGQLVFNAPAIPRLGHSGVQLVGRGAARHCPQRPRHRLPAGDRHGRDLGPGVDPARGVGDRRRGACQVPCHAAPLRRDGPLPGADLLVAQRQHLPRPTLGPRPGDVGRGSVPDRGDGLGVRARAAGRPPALYEGGGLRQALRGAQRTGEQAPRV